MPLPSPNFPLAYIADNEQDTSNDVPGDPTVANAADYNIQTSEIKATQQFIRSAGRVIGLNVSGATLTAGTLVAAIDPGSALATGAAIPLEVADIGFADLANVIGFVEADIANGANGVVITCGLLGGVDTSARTVGDRVYLGSTGAFTYTVTAVYVGYVVRSDVNGAIYIKAQLPYGIHPSVKTANEDVKPMRMLVSRSDAGQFPVQALTLSPMDARIAMRAKAGMSDAYVCFTHFFESTATSEVVSLVANGGAYSAQSSSASAPGVVRISAGTTANSTGRGFVGFGTAVNTVYLAHPLLGTFYFVCRCKVGGSNFDGTNQGELFLGFLSSNTGSPNDVIGFKSFNGGNWAAIAKQDGTESIISNVATSSTSVYTTFEILVNPPYTSAAYFIDGVSVGTIATNIPNAAADVLGPGGAFTRKLSSHAVGAGIDIDFMGIYIGAASEWFSPKV